MIENQFIECKQDRSFGQPTLKGRRLTVYDIVTKIYYEEQIDVAQADYQITREEAKSAIHYCMKLSCQDDRHLMHFCDGCLLRTLEQGWQFKRGDYIQIQNASNNKVVVSKDGKEIFFGSIQELENSEFGKVTWLIAENLYRHHFLPETPNNL
jgi:uncharacterized protein (DUF433 family)